MTTQAPATEMLDFLAGGGEVGDLIRAKDWSQTPLGPIDTWPPSLRTVVSLCLNSPFPSLVWWGPDLIQLYNDACRPLLGATRRPWALGAAGPTAWPELWPSIGPRLTRVMERGEAVSAEDVLLVLERNDHPQERYFTFSYSPIRDEAGGVGGVFTVVHETTQRVIAERRLATLHDALAQTQRDVAEALRVSEEKLQAALDGGRLGAWSWDPATNHTVADRRVLELFGIDPTSFTGDVAMIFERIHPADRDAVNAALRQAEQPGGQYYAEYRVVLPNGQTRWLVGAGRARAEADGQLTRVYGVNFDITERKHAEQERERLAATLDAFVASAPVGLAFLDTSFRYQRVNESLAALNGLPIEAHLGRTVPEILPTVWPGLEPVVRRVMDTGKPVVGMEVSGPTGGPSHETRTMLTSLFPVRLEDETSVGVGITVLDITDRKQAEEALREADRRKDEFLATLAHELRNPLAPIRNAVQILALKGPADPTVQAAHDLIDRQLSHMVRIIDDLLDVGRITRGKLDLRMEQVELADVIAHALETIRPLVDQVGHDLTVAVPSEPIYLEGDPVRLAQVFANLLNNAVKYTPAGGRIWLTAERQADEVAVSVRDSGAGIPPDHLASIFDMFNQVDRSLERAQGGLGIGLTLVKRLVEMHHGTVEALSEGPGRGSEFIVRLPVLGQVAPAAPTPPVVEAASETPPRRILIVDDHRDIATSLAELLAIDGHATKTARDGLEALDVAEAWRPDVVLLDIGLPKLNGYDVCRRIREQPWGQAMVVIAMTGWGQAEDRRQSQAAGFDYHLVKPVDYTDLMPLLASQKR